MWLTCTQLLTTSLNPFILMRYPMSIGGGRMQGLTDYLTESDWCETLIASFVLIDDAWVSLPAAACLSRRRGLNLK